MAKKKARGAKAAEGDAQDAAGAPAEGGDGADGAAEKKGGPLGLLKNKKVLMFGLPALILVLGGAGAGIMFMGGGEHAAAEAQSGDGHSREAAIAEAAAHVPHFYEMPELLVNINGGQDGAAFLKLKLNIEVSDETLMPVLDQNMPRVIDRYQGFLRELRPEDLSGSAGYYRLKLELLRRVNLAIAPAQADAVNIDQLLIQ